MPGGPGGRNPNYGGGGGGVRGQGGTGSQPKPRKQKTFLEDLHDQVIGLTPFGPDPDEKAAQDALQGGMQDWSKIFQDYRGAADSARRTAADNSLSPFRGYQGAMQNVYGEDAPDYGLDQIFADPWGGEYSAPGNELDRLFPPSASDVNVEGVDIVEPARYEDTTPKPFSKEAFKENWKDAWVGLVPTPALLSPTLTAIAGAGGFLDPSRGAPDTVVVGGVNDPPGHYGEYSYTDEETGEEFVRAPAGPYDGWAAYYADRPNENPPQMVRDQWDKWLEGEPPYEDRRRFADRVPDWYVEGEKRKEPKDDPTRPGGRVDSEDAFGDG